MPAATYSSSSRGSVKPGNMAELISQKDVDGALVGGASLEHGSFWEICRAAIEWCGTSQA